MRGVTAKDLVSVVDFIYYGEANIYQEDLDRFLTLAQEFQLKGLAGSQDNPLGTAKKPYEEPMQPKSQEKVTPQFEKYNQSTYHEARSTPETNVDDSLMVSVDAGKMLVAADTTMEYLRVKLDSMMEEHDDGENKWKCTVCGKATKGNDARRDMRRHIETHMEGLAYPCNQCGKVSRSSNALKAHMTSYHRK